MEIPGISLAPIIFIVLVIVPGVFVRRFYFLGEFSKQFGAGLFADRIITSIFWGVIVQICTFIPYSAYVGFTFADVSKSSISVYKAISDGRYPAELEKYDPVMILGYIVALIVMSALIGTVAHALIRITGLDISSRVFRFANDWHYYFTGEILRTSGFKEKRRKVISTSVDIFMDGGDQKPKRFSGILSQYTISARTGDLDTIILTSVRKYSEDDKSFKDIPSDLMVIPYSKVIDLNLRYDSPEERLVDGKKSKLLAAFANILVVLTLALVFVAPWFAGQSFLRTLFAIVILLIAWVLFTLIIAYLLDRRQRDKLKGSPWWFIIGMFFACSIIGAVLLKIPLIPAFFHEWWRSTF